MKVDNLKIKVGEQVMLQVPARLISRTIRETIGGTKVLASTYETDQNENTKSRRCAYGQNTDRGMRFTAKTLSGKNCTVEREE